ncbi:uncharacterized protein LOC126857077 isoform X2 [Cataglyphis hispanica]|uniref:uncharacterized protein LOC126857077 isoform X2 n=1 Tax=Cataglyphis hispanica TaxID=1086592 RepID=UPI00217FEF30|nr:uncharacterized protein LOC126857077 isoform X2 [Cataglyphis hispanica]
MNVGDITQLSYKELQALALRYHIPGNVKKKALIKVLQAAKSGNELEFDRLLQELRKSRKRKTRKLKDSRLGITSTPLHSPDYMMTDDDYYCHQQQQQPPQQQPAYQWIGAEEEIVSKDDETKIPHYEEFKQFLLKRIQREFQACDNNNNNQVQDLSIVNLRTTSIPPNLSTVPLDESSYSKANLINHIDPLAISSNGRSNYEIIKEPENGSQGSFLLKRMLQAPVGANLGEIASSIFWTSNLLDNSDTLTAESENNENENELETNTNEYYGLLKNTRGDFVLNDANLMSQQVPGAMTGDDQYRFSADVDNRPNPYQNWTITSVMEMPDSDLQTSKVYHAIYYNNTQQDLAVTTANADNNLTYQYQTDTAYNGSQNFFNIDAQDASNYATGTDMIVNDPNDIYYLQNFGKHSGEMGTSYFRNVDTFGQNNAQQNTYMNDQQYQYHYPRFIQETNNTLNERLDQQQNNVPGMENDVNHGTDAANMQRPANGIEPYWPKWTTETNNLENILNYRMSKQVDYSKLSQTSCVYCYVAPIVSQRSLTNNGRCSVERRYTAEQRQHSFSPYWMLYNDASQGVRMTNISSDSFVQHDTTTTMHTNIIPGNDILKDIVGDVPEAPINDVWMNQYESSSIGDDMTIPISDSIFCNDISSASKT